MLLFDRVIDGMIVKMHGLQSGGWQIIENLERAECCGAQ